MDQVWLLLWFLLSEVSGSEIIARGDQTAGFGDDVHYMCVLPNPTGVLQVTWQRLFNDATIENLAAYSTRFGQQVNNPYQNKVIFTEASLNSTSITVKNVTWADESCYVCSFNVYPDGSKKKHICLQVQGISSIKTDVQKVLGSRNEDGVKAVLSCSASGKPAPTIKWNFPPHTSSDGLQTITVQNKDHVFTSTSNVTVHVSSNWYGHVECLINSGMRGQKQQRLILPWHEDNNKEGTIPSALVFTVIAVGIICIIIITAVLVRKKWFQKNRSVV
ncbi:OX-2 membrane glycoprotein-like [Thalassophryne amazonica]|uniref:OX-2 membrane glycoprotein-like n=1 Tax=Thalassophryne amazonica TaxID=390379 RepID=UPI001471A416|nr:OX-2 membrane glycoprotein-like [Thalassophryne amazonica]